MILVHSSTPGKETLTGTYPTLDQLRQDLKMVVKPSLGAVFTLIATPDADDKSILLEKSVKGGYRLRKCVKDSKQTTAQYVKGIVDKQYAFLHTICKSEAKFKPCNLAIQFGDGSSTQVMVRYGNSAEDSKVSITQISVRIYVKLAENQIVSIIHADDELYEQLESAPSNPSELYISTSKQRDYSDAVIGAESRKKQDPYVILMAMKKNSNDFISIHPNPSAKEIEEFCKFDQVQRGEGTPGSSKQSSSKSTTKKAVTKSSSKLSPEFKQKTVIKKASPKSKQKILSKSKSASKAIQKAAAKSTAKSLTKTMSTTSAKKDAPKPNSAKIKSKPNNAKETKSPGKTTSKKGTKKKEQAKALGATIEKSKTDSSGSTKVLPKTSSTEKTKPKATPKSKPNNAKETKSSTKSTDTKKKEKPKASGARTGGSKTESSSPTKEPPSTTGKKKDVAKPKSTRSATTEKSKPNSEEKNKNTTTSTTEKGTKKIQPGEALDATTGDSKNDSSSPTGELSPKTGKRKISISENGKKTTKKAKKSKDPDAPTRPMSSYFLFCAEMREECKKNNPNGKAPTGKELGASYKELSNAKKASLDKKAAVLKDEYTVKKAAYDQKKKLENSGEPERVETPEPLTTQIKKKRAKKDPNAPKRPLSNYLLYCQDFRGKVKVENPDADPKSMMKILGEGYRNLNERDSAHYKELAEKSKEKYQIEMKRYKESLSN